MKKVMHQKANTTWYLRKNNAIKTWKANPVSMQHVYKWELFEIFVSPLHDKGWASQKFLCWLSFLSSHQLSSSFDKDFSCATIVPLCKFQIIIIIHCFRNWLFSRSVNTKYLHSGTISSDCLSGSNGSVNLYVLNCMTIADKTKDTISQIVYYIIELVIYQHRFWITLCYYFDKSKLT